MSRGKVLDSLEGLNLVLSTYDPLRATSYMLFNLYINQAIENIDNACKIPIHLNNSAYKTNVLMYADHVVILAESENELQTCLNELSSFCDEWKLSINLNKTKCIVFNCGNIQCKCKINVKGNLIDKISRFHHWSKKLQFKWHS